MDTLQTKVLCVCVVLELTNPPQGIIDFNFNYILGILDRLTKTSNKVDCSSTACAMCDFNTLQGYASGFACDMRE
jgi:hypothetical protein